MDVRKPVDETGRVTLLIVNFFSTSRDGPNDQKRLNTADDRIRQFGFGRFEGQIFLAGEESHEGPTLQCAVVANRPAQDGITGFERVQDGTQCYRPPDLNLHLALHASQVSQVIRKHDADFGFHIQGSVCTSTDKTPGKSRTMGFQESPLSAEP